MERGCKGTSEAIIPIQTATRESTSLDVNMSAHSEALRIWECGVESVYRESVNVESEGEESD